MCLISSLISNTTLNYVLQNLLKLPDFKVPIILNVTGDQNVKNQTSTLVCFSQSDYGLLGSWDLLKVTHPVNGSLDFSVCS